MKPAEKVAKIKAIADALESQEWEDVDLTLGQFGFLTSSEWRGDKRSYLIEYLQSGTSQALSELHDFVQPQDPPHIAASSDIERFGAEPWKTNGYRLFVSHVASEKGNVSKLAQALERHSIEAFVAHEAIEFGAEWVEVITQALDSCNGVLAMLSESFRRSDWCSQEVGYGVALKKMIVPIRFGEDPYGFISKYQGLTIAAKQPVAEIARSIFDLLVRHPKSRADMARVIVDRFKESASFAATRTNIGYLRMIPAEAWTADLRQAAVSAHEENGQIADTWVGARMAADVVAQIVPPE